MATYMGTHDPSDCRKLACVLARFECAQLRLTTCIRSTGHAHPLARRSRQSVYASVIESRIWHTPWAGLLYARPALPVPVRQAVTTNAAMWHWQWQGIMVNLEKTGQLVHVSHLEPVPYLPCKPYIGIKICNDLSSLTKKMMKVFFRRSTMHSGGYICHQKRRSRRMPRDFTGSSSS